MKQSRLMSVIEVLISNLVAFIIAVIVQGIVFNAYGFDATIDDNIEIVAIFTAISIARSFVLRRIFDWLGESPIAFIKRRLK